MTACEADSDNVASRYEGAQPSQTTRRNTYHDGKAMDQSATLVARDLALLQTWFQSVVQGGTESLQQAVLDSTPGFGSA